ncbi:BNR-4 repeat-containing protein, partial [Candidatus Latescibacterota bacterium]
YGGCLPGRRHLLAMASCYDHESHTLPRPTVVHDKGGVDDPHDNPSICLDESGHVWVFVSGRGRKRPGYKYRSIDPYSVDDFELVAEEELTYPQPWWIEREGFLHLHTMYTGVRELYWNRSDASGREWTATRKLAGIEGHYQTSRQRGRRVITAFNRHPDGRPDNRTDLYYLETQDLGETWRTADGTVVEPPLTEPDNAARIRDFAAEKRLVYMKDIDLDAAGNPVILVVASSDHRAGPVGDPRSWTIAQWTGSEWDFREITRSTHNYDMGSLYMESADHWRLIAPTEPGPQKWGTGGEMALWISDDGGHSWRKERDVTRDSDLNHTYARRPVNADPGFYAFWADGNPFEFSESRLYFTNREGDQVWRMPPAMAAGQAEPELIS